MTVHHSIDPEASWGFGEFVGRRVLVTGSSSGIGASVAEAFFACGAHVTLHYNQNRDSALALAARLQASCSDHDRVHVVGGDLSRPGVAARIVNEAASLMGGLDILINNAGHLQERSPASEMRDDLYRTLIDLNLTSVFEACRAAKPWLLKGTGAAIVNTTSVAARNGGGPGGGVYAAAKAGVSSLTRSLARELASEGIRVNAVAPGFIMTPLHNRLTSQESLDQARALIPMARIGEPHECAGAFLFLASNRLASYVTGQVLEVNGGQLMP